MPRSSSALLPSLKLSTLILCILIFSTLSFAAAPNRVTAPIVAAQTMNLRAGVPMQARPEFDQGAVDPSLKMSMTLLTVPSASQQQALTRLLADQQNPGSASYHKWLTPEQYADRFGLSVSDIAKLRAWLQSQGFSVAETARGRNWIVFTGTAAQVEKSFQTQIHNFKTNGQTHFANTTSPSIPAALSQVVVGVRGLNNFPAKSNAHRAQPGYTLTVGSNSFLFVAPGDVATIYDVNTLLSSGTDGTGQTLAVIGQTDVYLDDLNNFRSGFNINAISGCTTNSSGVITSCSGGNFNYVFAEASGSDPGSPSSGDLAEADIDLEWSNAVARNATIAYVNAPLTGVFTSAYFAIDNTIAPVITMSYTTPCELAEVGFFAADEAELKKANSLGITFMNSSGDTGAAECDFGSNLAGFGYAVAYPASSPEVTGVGGTSIPAIAPNEYNSTYWNSTNDTNGDGGSATGYIPEQPWNDPEEFGLICAANPSDSFCTHFGITDWASAQSVFGIGGGGGGVSNCFTTDANGVCNGGFPRPSWQAGIFAGTIDPSGAGETTTPARYTPDVSLLASANFPGYIVCTAQSEVGGSGNTSVCSGGAAGITSMLTACVNGTGPCSIFGGTSVSSPVFAGMVTLLNQYLGGSGLGNINPMLYSLAAANSTNKAFNSVITPNTGSFSNGAFCSPGTPTSGISGDPWPAALQCPGSGFLGFNAFDSVSSNGYNLVTGLGSVDFNNLALAWAAARTASTITVTSSQNPANFGASVTFTATVTTTVAPTGTVTIYDGTTALGSGTLSGGATGFALSTSSLTAGTHSITAVYGGDGYNAGSTSAVLSQVITAPTFTFVSTSGTPTSHTVLSGQISLNYSFTATPTSGATFVNAVSFSCGFAPTDATLTASVCSYSVNGGTPSTSATIPAGTGASTITMTIQTAGPNSGPGSTLRHRSDNRLPWLPLTLPLAGVVMVGFARRKMSRGATVAGLCLMLVLAGFLIACGSSSHPISITSVTGSSSSIFPQNTGWTNATATFTAVLVNDSGNKGVTWAVSPTLSGQMIQSTDATHATYTPPTIAAGLPSSVTITATAVADTSKTGNASIALNPTTLPLASPGYTVTVTAAEAGATSQTPSVFLVVQ